MPLSLSRVLGAAAVCLIPIAAAAQTIVTTEAELRTAISSAEPGETIVFGANITLTTGDLPSIATSVTIDGAGYSLSGNDQFRGLIVAAFGSGSGLIPVTVSIENLVIANTIAVGGTGGSGTAGGGGGAGFGGALFVASQATVSLSNVSVISSAAVGGQGGTANSALSGNGGGGGMGGDGGAGATDPMGFSVAGGGGGTGTGANGGSNSAGSAGILTGAGPGSFSGFPGGANGGGGGSGGFGGGGGGGVASGGALGGYGGGGGGDGGGSTGVAGFGGFGGGGGGGGNLSGGGGYGGGGGGTTGGFAGVSSFGGGRGANGAAGAGGGGGAGFGGAIFVESGGSINVAGPLTINGSRVSGGAGAAGAGNGIGAGAGMFMQGSGTITFGPGAGTTITIADQIADETGVEGPSSDLGSWTVAKNGAGTLVLSGQNLYSGGTVVNAGTLSVATAANLGLGDVALNNTSTLAVTGSTTFTQDLTISDAPILNIAGGQSVVWSGVINESRVGQLTVTGGGSLTLANADNQYSGGTLVNGGSSVMIGSDSALGSGNVTLGDALSTGTLGIMTGNSFATGRTFTLGAGGGIFDVQGTSDVLELTGSVGGSGGLTKSGSGTLTLTGATTYTGATTIAGGVLRAGRVDVLATSDRLTVASGGLFDLNNFNQAVSTVNGDGNITLGTARLTIGGGSTDSLFGGVISGAGQLFKVGGDTLVLTGANSYSGGTTVSGGILMGNTTSLQGAITNNAQVVFDQAGQGTYSGAMIGTGSLTKAGTGVLTLTGANTYSGGTFVSAGALVGTTTSLQGNISNNALVIFNQSSDGTYAGAMSGSGMLAKTGTGPLTLTGLNTHTGGTIVAGNGAIATSSNAPLGASGGLVVLGDATTSGTLRLASGSAFSMDRPFILGAGGGTFDTAGSSSIVVNGAITGSGGLRKTGSGTLTLGKTNGFTGATNVDAGIVIAGAQNVFSGTGALAIANGATVALSGFNQSIGSLSGAGKLSLGNATLTTGGDNTSTLFSGAITGTGGLVKIGRGTLTLTGANSYTGGTTVAAGVLRAGTGNVFGANTDLTVAGGARIELNGFAQTFATIGGSGSISLGGAALTVGSRSSSLFAGSISGSGSLRKVGSGTLFLTGANSYSGGTTVSDGILAGNTAGLQGNIENNALVVFDESGNATYAGSMSGSGGLAKTGLGTLTLTGLNTYSGGTTIMAGTLAGNTSSLQGTIVNNGTVAFIENGNGSFNGVLAGTGSAVKSGAGTLSLFGTHPMTGNFTVSQGTLALNGAFGGSFSVGQGATLAGTGGVVGSLTVSGSLTVAAPSGSSTAPPFLSASAGGEDRLTTPPAFTIGGNFNAPSGSILNLPIGSGPNPSILVGGSAVLDGAHLNLTPVDIPAERRSLYLALATRDGLRLTNTSAVTDRPTLVPILTPVPTSLYVLLLNYEIPLTITASTPNAAGVAAAIDRFKTVATGDTALVVQELTALNDNELRVALDTIAGEIHASSTHLGIIDSEAFSDLVRAGVNARDREGTGERWSWWTELRGERGTFEDDGVHGGKVNLGGGASGFDYRPPGRWIFGAGGGFAKGDMTINNVPASTDYQAPRAFGYAGFRPQSFGITGGISTARSRSKTDRRIAFAAGLPQLGLDLLTGGIDREARAEETSLLSDEWGEYADNLNVKSYRVDWNFGIRHARFARNGFSEEGAGALALTAIDQVLNLRQADVKLHVWRRQGNLRPFAETMFRREMSDAETRTALKFTDTPDSEFDADGLPVPGNAFTGRFGVSWMTLFGALTFEYQIKRAPNQSRQAFDVRMRFK
jgi:autotransporter-associated beta strand protein